jgi:hypothetical protein
LAELDPALVETARQIVAQAEQAKKIDVRKIQNERVEQTLEMALTRTQGDVSLAADLVLRWCEADSQVRDQVLQPLIRIALEDRLAAIPRAEPVV